MHGEATMLWKKKPVENIFSTFKQMLDYDSFNYIVYDDLLKVYDGEYRYTDS